MKTVMLADAERLRTWERAEIVRSAAEARHSERETLEADPAQLARYSNPPLDTPYPLEYAYALLGDVRGRTLVDLGCGSGENTLLLALRGASVYATDISQDLLALARRRLAVNEVQGPVMFVAGSAHQLALQDASVDVVFGIAVLHHLDLMAAADEVRRVLKPGGRGIFQEPFRSSALLRGMRRLIPYRAPDVSPFERPLTGAEVAAFRGRFARSRGRAFSLPFVNVAQVLPVVRNAVHTFYRLDRQVLSRVPRLSHFATVQVFEVTR
jgi:SAM-dependent methyltransferase